jgi:hypothetical protein
MDYRLEALSSRSFEQLVQSIGVLELGPGLVVFGDGPDGGREATFDGTLPRIGTPRCQAGYLVVQAKFLQRPRGARTDGAWALDQLRSELKTYRAGGRRLPDFYLFATNATLSPVAGTGAKDAVLSCLADAVNEGLVKEFLVWDYDQLCRFLDAHDGLRRAYAAWITPGDILASLADAAELVTPDFRRTLSVFLQKELLGDQYASLEQAGHSPEDRIPIGRVFVDLPVSISDDWRHVSNTTADSDAAGFLQTLLPIAHERLAPISAEEAPSLAESPSGHKHALRSRHVLVGGPGQGKTTLGQFICQLFRVSFLRDLPVDEVSEETRFALRDVTLGTNHWAFPIPSVRRFPLRVVLSEFATVLDKDPALSLLRYIIRRIERRVDREVPTDVFRRWLGRYPWLLVLDGLDEVPSSSNRDELMRAISELFVDIADSRCDLLVIATTRPQGYADEFAPDLYTHWELSALSELDALGYAKRLVTTRYSGDQDRQDKIMNRLERATKSQATARLMQSPLQVTIMATLVDQLGKAPEQRWSLFSEYYGVIYKREAERDIRASRTLREHKPDIDEIHRRVALLLQRESENAANTEAHLSIATLEQIVEARLAAEEHEGEDLRRLTASIIEAAADRLVFLVGAREGRVGFEIRALQEYMAADALMDGEKDDVAERLRAIAVSPAWRNVLLFGAGQCFAARQRLRDSVYVIVSELNDSTDDLLARTRRLGSWIALELLEDGSARSQPRYSRLLAKTALRLLGAGPATDDRLAQVYDPTCEREYNAAFSDPGADLQARWRLLAELARRRVEWATSVMFTAWPQDPDAELRALRAVAPPPVNWTNNWLTAAQNHDIDRIEGALPSRVAAAARNPPTGATWRRLAVAFSASNKEEFSVTLAIPVRRKADGHTWRPAGREVSLRGRAVDARPWKHNIRPRADGRHPSWNLPRHLAEFHNEPGSPTLAKTLRWAQDIGSRWRLGQRVAPWPIGACLAVGSATGSWPRLIEAAESGVLGDASDWRAAEARWQTAGVGLEDLTHTPPDDLPMDSEIAQVGFPLELAQPVGTFPVTMLADALSLVTTGQREQQIASMLHFGLIVDAFGLRGGGTHTWASRLQFGAPRARHGQSGDQGAYHLAGDLVEKMIRASNGESARSHYALLTVVSEEEISPGLLDALDSYGRRPPLHVPLSFMAARQNPLIPARVLSDFIALAPDCVGLWNMAAHMMASGDRRPILGEIRLPDIDWTWLNAESPQAACILAVVSGDVPGVRRHSPGDCWRSRLVGGAQPYASGERREVNR